MKRTNLIDYLASQILLIEKPHPIRVAIDGPDAAGKTILAEELASRLQDYNRPVIRASIDGFHNPAHIRHRRGRISPEGYYQDSFNHRVLIESLLIPLGQNGNRRYVSAIFDYRTDSELQTPARLAEINAVLIFDGVFLLRTELVDHWDFTIYVDATFEATLVRAEQRDKILFGSVEEIRNRYQERYIPGQKLYFADSRPKERAKVVIDNNDPRNPVILENRGHRT